MNKSKQRITTEPLEPLSLRERGRGEGTAEARHHTTPDPSPSSERSSFGWHTTRFDAFATLQRGFDLPVASRKVGTIPVLGSNGIVGWHDTVGVRGPGVVTGRSGSIGDSTFSDTDYWPLNTSLYVSNFHGNVPRFVHYFLQWFDLARFKGGVSVPTLNRNMVHGSEVTVPPKPEQQKIAAVLWKMQRAIATQDRLIAATRDLKQSAMQHLFTHGLRGEPLKDTEIGPMPESWDVEEIRAVAVIKGGKRLPKGVPLSLTRTPFPYIRVTDFAENSVDTSDIRYVPPDVQPQIARYVITTKDVYISIAGSIGLVGMVPLLLNGANLTENAARILAEERIEPAFLMRFLSSPFGQSQIASFTSKNAQPKLALTRIEDIRIPVPRDLDEQRDITTALATIDRKLAHHQKKRAALNDLFQTTLHQLMTAQIRVTDLDIDTSEVTGPSPQGVAA